MSFARLGGGYYTPRPCSIGLIKGSKHLVADLRQTIDHLLGSERVLYRSLVNILFYKEMEMRVTAYHRDVKGFVFKE